ncbi:MAG: glycosyltransferase [Deltaproteobacteria bacterium]|nr:glycosyltransferase [Deltaproteobacteria bacterium]MBW2152204.1 glycosyltransferase [Deltaproteobacteria bacterium]
MSSRPILTAVICTRGDRPVLFSKCLESLMDQEEPKTNYEILIVDNGPRPRCEKLVDQYRSGGLLRYVHEPISGLSRARNCGWKNAAGDYVGYIDDDATASRKWVSYTIKAFQICRPTPDWVGGPILLDWEKPRPEWVNEEMCVPLGKVYWGDRPCKLDNNQRLGGGNSIFQRRTLEALGGFDENLGRKGRRLLSGEETQLQKRIQQKGGVLFYHPDISVWHHVSSTRLRPGWFYRRYFWGGISDSIMGRTLSRNQDLAGESEKSDLHGKFHRERFQRLIQNTTYALGLSSSKKKRIWGRTYMFYCLGYLLGSLWRTDCQRPERFTRN